MRILDEVVSKLLRRSGVRKEVLRIEREEGALLDVMLKARQDAGLTQAQGRRTHWNAGPLQLT